MDNTPSPSFTDLQRSHHQQRRNQAKYFKMKTVSSEKYSKSVIDKVLSSPFIRVCVIISVHFSRRGYPWGCRFCPVPRRVWGLWGSWSCRSRVSRVRRSSQTCRLLCKFEIFCVKESESRSEFINVLTLFVTGIPQISILVIYANFFHLMEIRFRFGKFIIIIF